MHRSLTNVIVMVQCYLLRLLTYFLSHHLLQFKLGFLNFIHWSLGDCNKVLNSDPEIEMSSLKKSDKKAVLDLAAWSFNITTSVGIIMVNKA
jgi:hypothetical protein